MMGPDCDEWGIASPANKDVIGKWGEFGNINLARSQIYDFETSLHVYVNKTFGSNYHFRVIYSDDRKGHKIFIEIANLNKHFKPLVTIFIMSHMDEILECI